MSEHITRVSLAEVIDGDRTDWSYLGNLSDSAINASIVADDDTFVMDPAMASAQYVIYQDNAGLWRWRLMNAVGDILARSGGSFDSEAAALAAVGAVRSALVRARAA